MWHYSRINIGRTIRKPGPPCVVRGTIFSWLFTACAVTACAQKPFSEGVLLYEVYLVNADQAPDGATAHTRKGIYRLSIKKEKVKKDFILDDGKNTRTSIADHQTGTRLVLREHQGVFYAIETGLESGGRGRSSSLFTPSGNTKILNGYKVVLGKLKLAGSGTIEGYVYPDYYLPYPAMLPRFDGMRGIPAEFTLTLNNGSRLHFELKALSEEPVLNATFSIPDSYRRISRDAYKEFRHDD